MKFSHHFTICVTDYMFLMVGKNSVTKQLETQHNLCLLLYFDNPCLVSFVYPFPGVITFPTLMCYSCVDGPSCVSLILVCVHFLFVFVSLLLSSGPGGYTMMQYQQVSKECLFLIFYFFFNCVDRFKRIQKHACEVSCLKHHFDHVDRHTYVPLCFTLL